LYLAGAGLKALDICEPDTVDESNLHRQVLYTDRNVGVRKAPIASMRVREMNEGRIESSYAVFPFQQAGTIKAGAYDVVLDCTDRWSSHDEVISFYMKKRVPVVHGSIQGLIGRVMTFTHNTPCWRCLHPEKPTGTKEGPRGTLGPVCGVIGSLMAMEALRILLGHGPGLAGEMLVYSAMKSQFERMTRTFDPACSCQSSSAPSLASTT
jgi:adenylyltransferase/sulfurtransferase